MPSKVSSADFIRAVGYVRRFGWTIVTMTDGAEQLRAVRDAGERARLELSGHARELLEEFARGVLGKGRAL
jgi:hypothetical protein